MQEEDTSVGRAFPQTSWGLICRVRGVGEENRQEALDTLSRRYWKPVFSYVRIVLSKQAEDAKDLCQDFFIWLSCGEVLQKYVPERGSFRSYLKGLLRNYRKNYDRAGRSIKRGGAVRHFALENDVAELSQILPDPKNVSPDEIFDMLWRSEVLERSLERCQEYFKKSGLIVYWNVFDQYVLQTLEEKATYKVIAEGQGIKESDVRNYLFAVRERLKFEIQTELGDTVSCREDLDEEWSALFG